jgi:hypothetical protein
LKAIDILLIVDTVNKTILDFLEIIIILGNGVSQNGCFKIIIVGKGSGRWTSWAVFLDVSKECGFISLLLTVSR